jgi:hypothetical protein
MVSPSVSRSSVSAPRTAVTALLTAPGLAPTGRVSQGLGSPRLTRGSEIAPMRLFGLRLAWVLRLGPGLQLDDHLPTDHRALATGLPTNLIHQLQGEVWKLWISATSASSLAAPRARPTITSKPAGASAWAQAHPSARCARHGARTTAARSTPTAAMAVRIRLTSA